MQRVFFFFVLGVLLVFTSCSSSIPNNPDPGGGAEEPAFNLYFGDIHAHTAYSNDALMIQLFASGEENVSRRRPLRRGVADIVDQYLTVASTPSSAIQHARENGLDFVAITDHAEQIDIPGDALLLGGNPPEWEQLQQVCNEQNGQDLVVFIGFEFTKTAATDTTARATEMLPGGGHKCVIFKDSNVPAQPFPATDQTTPEDLWNYLQGYDCITIPHHPARGEGAESGGLLAFSGTYGLQNWIFDEIAMSTDWDFIPSDHGFSPGIMPAVEIFSVHGSSEAEGYADLVPGFDPNRSVESALNRWFLSGYKPDYKLGIVGSTDDHLGNPGNTNTDQLEEGKQALVPEEGDFSGGLIGAWAQEKTRASIFEAIEDKRVYATTGPKIQLEFSATYQGTKYWMGQTVPLQVGDALEYSFRAVGDTAPLDYVEVIFVRSTGPGTFETIRATHDAVDGTAYSLDLSAMTGNAYVRVTAYQQQTTRWQWNGTSFDALPTRERAFSSPIWIEVQ
ncbi:MAG TPA: DUF3604 domain-containing protein [Thermotogota bacterium]|nr:DUF3604 domain-containing protein [Thermotogota bacterium]